MLDKKFYTTPLLAPEQKSLLNEQPVQKPPFWRVFWIIWRFSLLMIDFVRSKFSHHLSNQVRAVKIREFLEHLGGMWIKLGQVMAMRSDIFSSEFCHELSRLQDRAVTFSPERSIHIIEANLNCAIHDIFEDFEAKPFAAASLSQAHKARLRGTRKWVVVKVQRPYAADYFNYDFKWMSLLCSLIDYLGVLKYFHFDEMLNELQHMIAEELDYRQEASNMKRMGKILKRHKIYVPKVYFEYSSRVILTMEYINGVFMSDYISVRRRDPQKAANWLQINQIDTGKVARRLLQSALRQLYEDLQFHGDLHPGNIILLKSNSMAFIDFGSVGRIDPRFAAQYEQYFRALSMGEIDKAVDILLITMGQLPVLDVGALKKRLVKVMEKQADRSSIKNLPYHEKSISANSAEISQVMAQFHININWNMLKMGRMFETVDQNISVLNPDFNFIEELNLYQLKATKRRFRKAFESPPNPLMALYNLSEIAQPAILNKLLQFDGRGSRWNHLALFMLGALKNILLLALAGSAWAYCYQYHYPLVADYHAGQSLAIAKWIESIPVIHRYEWYFIGVVTILVIVKIQKFSQVLLNPPVRLPGDWR
jgi:ubiquinone biosynthesis protein